MKPLIINALGPLASRVYQARHVARWVGDDSRLPHELVDRALLELSNDLDSEVAMRAFNTEERYALSRCFEVLCVHAAAMSFDAVDAGELISISEHWLAIRSMAAETLVAMGSSTSDWERMNLGANEGATALCIERFSPEHLRRAPDATRPRLLADLADVLTARLSAARDFDEAAAQITAELWGIGHDLWRVDMDQRRELWSAEPTAWPRENGLVIELHRSGRATVRWTGGTTRDGVAR